MGSSGGGDKQVTTRYAPYVERYHSSFLSTVQSKRNTILNNSPFADYIDIDVDNAFFGAGYLVSSFPSLYDMFGKFMAGLDIETLWGNLARDELNKSEADAAVAAEMKNVNEQADSKLAEFQIR